jgi:hypothetical protein
MTTPHYAYFNTDINKVECLKENWRLNLASKSIYFSMSAPFTFAICCY